MWNLGADLNFDTAWPSEGDQREDGNHAQMGAACCGPGSSGKTLLSELRASCSNFVTWCGWQVAMVLALLLVTPRETLLLCISATHHSPLPRSNRWEGAWPQTVLPFWDESVSQSG